VRARRPLRVGLYGLLGIGNIGNDASMESVLRYLRTDHPDAVVDAMCAGPKRIRTTYGIGAVPLYWGPRRRRWSTRVPGLGSAMKILTIGVGVGVEAVRTARWVRRHDVVIVPGMGVLEAILPLRPWETPYAMFLLCAWGKIFRTKVALVSVGADRINQRSVRWLLVNAARLAYYRSYRDEYSRDALRAQGVDTSNDHVFPDLVFGPPTVPHPPGDLRTVGVGVMAYHGSNDDRARAAEIHASYLENVTAFVCRMLDEGRRVRLFPGDGCDNDTMRTIIAEVRAGRPHLSRDRVTGEPLYSFSELMRAMAPVDAVVATRFHNVMCALKLGKPTVSIGYSNKNLAIMTEAGLGEFCQYAHALDVERLVEQLAEIEAGWPEVAQPLADHNAAKARGVAAQFALLSELLFSV